MLVQRLAAIRRRIRVQLVVYGLFFVATGGVMSFLTIVTLDWLLWFPGAIRILVAALFLGGFVLATWRWVVAPLRAPLSIDAIAGRLEKHFGGFQDRLISTVDFVHSGEHLSNSMMRQVVTNTENLVRDIPLESALTYRPLLRAGALLTTSTAVLVSILLVSPVWGTTGWVRYADPFGGVGWPRSVEIVPVSGDMSVAIGESAEVAMRVTRGLDDKIRSIVQVVDSNGDRTALTLQPTGDGVFATTVDSITSDVTYWFEAGDADTRYRPFKIVAVRRPVVVESLATVHPPPYAPERPDRVHDLNDGPVRAPVGGSVTVSVRSSKPEDRGDSRAGLRLSDGSLVPLTTNPEMPSHLMTTIPVEADVRFRIELVDGEGFQNRGAIERTIRAVADTAPVVAVIAPAAVTELTPIGKVVFSVRLEDDFGLSNVSLEVVRTGTDQVETIDLSPHMALDTNSERVEASVQYDLSMRDRFGGQLHAGDLLVASITAGDNRMFQDQGPQLSQSVPVQLKIISEAEFEMRLRDDIALLEARIRDVALDQTKLLDDTSALLQDFDGAVRLTSGDRDRVQRLGRQQFRVARNTHDLSHRFDALAARVARNHADPGVMVEQIEALSQRLRSVADRRMTSAGALLNRTREQPIASAQQATLSEATGMQEDAAEQLRAVIRSMSQWGNHRALVSKTRDLLDRQESLRAETRGLGKSTIGKQTDSLSVQEAAELARLRRLQEQLATDAEQLIERLEREATSSGDSDPAAKDASEAALRAARANDIVRHSQGAVSGIEQNRLAAANLDQKRTADALRKTLMALEKRDARELERLRKNLQRAEDAVAGLIEDQTDIKRATEEAGLVGGDADALGELGQQQRMLRQNTEHVADQLGELERSSAAGRQVKRSAKPMAQAEKNLGEGQPEGAANQQADALEHLDGALELLRRLAMATDQEALQRSLLEIQASLTTMRDTQASINEGIATVRVVIESKGRVGRSEAREAAKLARRQVELRLTVEETMPDLEKVMVYKWALDRIAGWMEESRDRLQSRRLDDELASHGHRIVRELGKLIQAIVDTQALPMDAEFAEAEADGGGQGGATQSKPVPTLAELFVLKAMQEDVNDRTVTMHDTVDAATASETQLRNLALLGEDQAEVKRLTELVTGRVKEP